MTSPAASRPEPEPARQLRAHVPVEPGERFDDPYQPGDPLELPETTWKRERGPDHAFAGFGYDPQAALATLRLVPRHHYESRDDEVADAYDPSPEQARLDELRRLARWCPATANIAAMLETRDARIAEYDRNGKKPPKELLAERVRVAQQLEQCERRDALQARRPEGCRCLGAGAFGETTHLTVSAPGDPAKGIPPRVIYSEGTNGPLIHLDICDHCAEGRAYRAWVREQLAAMRLRGEAGKALKLWGGALIPAVLVDCTLATYPFPEQAERAEKWLRAILGELEVERGIRDWLFMSGLHRRGKTGLAVSLMKAALERGIECLFRDVPTLLEELRACYDPANPNQPLPVLEALMNVPLLILDDLGAEHMTDWTQERLYLVLNHRHLERLHTIITTNVGWATGKWRDGELSDRVGGRIAARIISTANHLSFKDIPYIPPSDDLAPRVLSSAAPPDHFTTW